MSINDAKKGISPKPTLAQVTAKKAGKLELTAQLIVS